MSKHTVEATALGSSKIQHCIFM